MSNGSISFLSSQIGTQVPVLLVYLVTLVLALVYLRRVPLVAALALTGTLILMMTSIALPMIQWFMISRGGSGYTPAFILVVMATSVIRAAGLSFLVAAIFVGRGRTSPGSYDANTTNSTDRHGT